MSSKASKGAKSYTDRKQTDILTATASRETKTRHREKSLPRVMVPNSNPARADRRMTKAARANGGAKTIRARMGGRRTAADVMRKARFDIYLPMPPKRRLREEKEERASSRSEEWKSGHILSEK